MSQALISDGQPLRQILGAVGYGNRQREIRAGDIKEHVTRIEEHQDLPTEG